MKVCCLTARKQRRCGAGGSFSAFGGCRLWTGGAFHRGRWRSQRVKFGWIWDAEARDVADNAVNSEGKTIWQRTDQIDQHQSVWEKVGEHVARRKDHQSIHEKPVSMPVRVVDWACLQHSGPPRLDGMNVSQCLLVILYFGKLQSIIIFFSNMGTPSPSQCLLVIR